MTQVTDSPICIRVLIAAQKLLQSFINMTKEGEQCRVYEQGQDAELPMAVP